MQKGCTCFFSPQHLEPFCFHLLELLMLALGNVQTNLVFSTSSHFSTQLHVNGNNTPEVICLTHEFCTERLSKIADTERDRETELGGEECVDVCFSTVIQLSCLGCDRKQALQFFKTSFQFILEISFFSPESLLGLFCQLNNSVYRHSQGVGITENHTLHICLS